MIAHAGRTEGGPQDGVFHSPTPHCAAGSAPSNGGVLVPSPADLFLLGLATVLVVPPATETHRRNPHSSGKIRQHPSIRLPH
jgi:hypothetical protein